MSVIKAEFGVEKRQAARRLRTLLSLSALHEANVRANPVPYLERASERIYQLEKVLFEAAQAARPPLDEGMAQDLVSVDRRVHDGLMACRDIVEAALILLAAEEGES
ncbi:hypothetical protein V5F77_03120 [Xanthobacter sp. DSM 24535]